jgi:hypothetical protein
MLGAVGELRCLRDAWVFGSLPAAMNTALRNVMSFIAGFVAGSLVNMALVKIGYALVPPPAGLDTSTAEAFKATAHLMEPRHFGFPFLAHAMGTFIGALLVYMMAGSHRAALAYGIGVLTLCGGILAALIIPAPKWFLTLDLLFAYLPMAWLATKVGARLLRRRTAAA